MVKVSPTAVLRISGLWTVTEASRMAAVEPCTILNWIYMGKLPAAKLGNIWVVTEEDLAALLVNRVG